MKWEAQGDYHQHSGDYTIIRFFTLNNIERWALWGPGKNHGYFPTEAKAKKRAEEITSAGWKNER